MVLGPKCKYPRKVIHHIDVVLEIAEWPSYEVSINMSVRIERRRGEDHGHRRTGGS